MKETNIKIVFTVLNGCDHIWVDVTTFNDLFKGILKRKLCILCNCEKTYKLEEKEISKPKKGKAYGYYER